VVVNADAECWNWVATGQPPIDLRALGQHSVNGCVSAPRKRIRLHGQVDYLCGFSRIYPP